VASEFIDWDGKKVMMLLPVYRSFNADTHYTLFANYARYGPEKIGMEIIKGTVIHESRNLLVHSWMKTDIPTAIMCDDDMLLPCGHPGIINGRYKGNLPDEIASKIAISQIMSHGKDKGIVGCLYFGRHDKGRAQCASGFASDSHNDDYKKFKHKTLRGEDWAGTGMLKIERWVIHKMKDEIDGGRWPECKPRDESQWYGYFTPIQVGVGEDVSFGRRAKEIGIQSYVDPQLICLHVGDTAFGPTNVK